MIVVLNKVDLIGAIKTDVGSREELELKWGRILPNATLFSVSALEGQNTDAVFHQVLEHLPESPPLYPADTLTDKTERFFASEIIREQIFKQYSQEVPYSCEVVVREFKRSERGLHIDAAVLVSRDSQKGILIGKAGRGIQALRTASRQSLRSFFDTRVDLDVTVKLLKDWRLKDDFLREAGYLS